MVEQSQYSYDLETSGSSTFVSTDHFGGNIIATKNILFDGGPFQSGVESLGINSLRYPGGTVTEQYFDPHGSIWEQLFGTEPTDIATAPDGVAVLGPRPFFEFANQNGLGVTFVLPTATLIARDANGNPTIDASALQEVRSVVGEIIRGNFGTVQIETFEIGNEYYNYAGLTAAEYGLVANDLIKAIGAEFSEFENSGSGLPEWDRPDIAVQAGAGWQDGDNEDIISSLDYDARALVDRVTVHYYPQDLNQVDNFDGIFNQIDAWEGATGFGDLNFFASEWNIQNSTGSDTGMAQASSLIAAFDEMLKEGVDSAAIWGVQNRWLDTSLTTLNSNNEVAGSTANVESRLTAAGEIFASMAESLQGLQTFELDQNALVAQLSVGGTIRSTRATDIEINSFGNGERAVLYISSRSDEVIRLSLDLDQYFNSPSHIWAETLTTIDDPATRGTDESDPLHSRGLPVFDSITADQLGSDDTLVLSPHAIIRINLQLDGRGVTMLGHDPQQDGFQDFDDTFNGSSGDDSINGYAGNDQLLGLGGDDAINGDRGHDTIFGGAGNDVERGGVGEDHLEGQVGNDVLMGGDGNDFVSGGDGDDIVSGGEGDNRVFGGSGNDLIFASNGYDTLVGGEGSDYFIASSTGQTVITDWQFDSGDQITFLGQFKDAEDLAEHASETQLANGSPGDLVLTNEAGGETTFVGGAGQLNQLLAQVVDFTDAGQDALDLADNLNNMSNREIGAYLDSLSTEEFNEQVISPDPVILLASLESSKAALFLSYMDTEETDNFLDNTGRDGLSAFFEELNVGEAEDFVSAISSPALIGFLDEYGGSEFLSRLDDCSEAIRSTFFEKVDGTKYDYLADGQLNGESDSTDPDDGELPTVPVDEETEEEPEEASSDDPSMACFVATAAYDNANHPDVWTLRWYRDNVLRTYVAGRFFIWLYWRVGPSLAGSIKHKPNAIKLARFALSIFVRALCKLYKRTSGRQIDHNPSGSGWDLSWIDLMNGQKRLLKWRNR